VKKPKITPALVLFLLSPAIGELLSGSSPPLEFFNPIGFVLMALLYGSGAIIMRELKIRWKKDFRSLLLLGGAYGILEEGLMVKSFFDPNWMDLGILGSFGRWMEVNWVWAEMLTIYHAVFSITIPIVLVELAYPERKEERWIGIRMFTALAAVLGTANVIGFLYLTQYRPPALQYLLAMLAISLFIYAAYKLPSRKTSERTARTAKARNLFILGCVASFAFFLLFYSGPYVIDSPIIVMLLEIVLIVGAGKYLARFDWKKPESDLSRLALVAGGLSFMIFLAFLQEPKALGMSLVGLTAIAGILLLRSRMKRHEQRKQTIY
jgi:hypothetical protein